jgi:hypothetical protein
MTSAQAYQPYSNQQPTYVGYFGYGYYYFKGESLKAV